MAKDVECLLCRKLVTLKMKGEQMADARCLDCPFREVAGNGEPYCDPPMGECPLERAK